MLKLTMNPRKRSRKTRSHHKAKCLTEQAIVEQRSMLRDNLQVLLRQEKSSQYRCIDYLSMTGWQRSVYDLLKRGRNGVHQQGDARVDEYCREQIVEWSFRVVDYFRIDREVVAVSMSILDRFLGTCRCDRSTFKLAATSTLNLAVKLLHPCKLGDLGILSDLSRGEFDMSHVAEMEGHILKSLSWSLNPPTATAFATLLLDCMVLDRSVSLTSTDTDDLHDISSFFTELALCDYYFVTMEPSQIAIAALCNALEGMFGHNNKYQAQVIAAARALNVYFNQDLSIACHRLWELYERSEECAIHNNYDPMEEEKSPDTVFVKKQEPKDMVVVGGSPVSVTSSASMSNKDFLCTMRSQSLQNGSW
eukprot:Nitzschia sp. Nitz4//scaffold35_size145790//43111//44199//NITZ4_003019-RA/size145790-processed-gene-0.230-mRNA-1//-1//CDS//3329549091//5586//frame0